MTDVIPSVGAQPLPAAGTPFESRAAQVFTVIAAFIAIIGAIVVLFANDASSTPLVRIGLGLVVVLAVVLYSVEVRGLRRLEPWAVAAATPLLGILIVFDVFNFVIGFGQGKLNLPIATVLGIWALRGQRAIRPAPSLGPAGIVLVVVDLALSLATINVSAVVGPGGLLDLRQDDLQQTLAVDCGPSPGSPPAKLAITYRWSWRRDAFLAGGDDAIVVRWFSAGTDGSVYVLGDTPQPTIGLEPGGAGPLSGGPAQAWAGGGLQSFTWAIDLSTRGMAPGEVRLDLGYAGGPRPQEPFHIDARYFHLGTWRSQQLFADCTWR
jgi:hypothetical protein